MSSKTKYLLFTLFNFIFIFGISHADQYGPLIDTHWSQHYPYNSMCPTKSQYSADCRIVGCVATAMSQIINKWRYPKYIHFNSSSDSYDYDGINYDDDSSTYNFPDFNELNDKLSFIKYEDTYSDEDILEKAYLNFGVGIKLKMNYKWIESENTLESLADTGDVAKALKNEFSYGSAEKVYWNAWEKSKNKVIENIKKGWPVQAALRIKGTLFKGHSVIIDGYRDTDEKFHINFGFDDPGYYNTWYELPSDDLLIVYPPLDIDSSERRFFDKISKVVYDIFPDKAWNQYGSDEKNTFGSIYDAPTSDFIVNKWQVSPLSNYKFKGLVIGSGYKIYATLYSNDLNQGYNPGLWVLSQYGDKEEAYYIPEDEKITSPVQNSKGEVFVAASEGGIYKLDTIEKSLTKIYQNPSGQGFETLKVDSDDYLYATSLDQIVSITSDGTLRWSFYTPSGGQIYVGQPSIDVSKNNLYIGYYNSVFKTSHLAAINRLNGNLRYEEVFNNIDSSSGMTGVVSIGSDGTVFSNTNGVLSAFTP